MCAGALDSSHVGRGDPQKLRVESLALQFARSIGAAFFVARAQQHGETVIVRQLARGFETAALVGAGNKRDFVSVPVDSGFWRAALRLSGAICYEMPPEISRRYPPTSRAATPNGARTSLGVAARLRPNNSASSDNLPGPANSISNAKAK